ncbi:MAG TPA: glycosyltransferase family 10 [Candidatus Babeliales bacterium]|nr:glycosyltransferase family 10 [Candidatus Babeliales bacterium]
MKKKFLLFLLISLSNSAAQKKLYFLYDLARDYGDFFQQDEHDYGFWKKFRLALAKKGYTGHAAQYSQNKLKEAYDADCVIFFNLPISLSSGKLKPLRHTAAFLFEPPATSPHQYQQERWKSLDKVFTWNDECIDNKKSFKFHWMQYNLNQNNPIIVKSSTPFEQKKLCTMMNSNRHSNHPQALFNKRLEVIDFFDSSNSNDFDLYGRSCPGGRHKNYKGAVDDKYKCISDYKFYICIENMDGPAGHITEKIFDCFFGRCIPVYLGAPNIEKYIPANCFINMRKFKSNQDLLDHLKKMGKEEHEQYLSNIEEYLKSKKAYPFSQEAMIENYISCLP